MIFRSEISEIFPAELGRMEESQALPVIECASGHGYARWGWEI